MLHNKLVLSCRRNNPKMAIGQWGVTYSVKMSTGTKQVLPETNQLLKKTGTMK